eukprot:3890169-Pyramimonas_sp.AAC.1
MDILGSQGWVFCGRFLVDWPPLYPTMPLDGPGGRQDGPRPAERPRQLRRAPGGPQEGPERPPR